MSARPWEYSAGTQRCPASGIGLAIVSMVNPVTRSLVRIEPPFEPTDCQDADSFETAFWAWCERQWEIKTPCGCLHAFHSERLHGGDPATANPADFYLYRKATHEPDARGPVHR